METITTNYKYIVQVGQGPKGAYKTVISYQTLGDAQYFYDRFTIGRGYKKRIIQIDGQTQRVLARNTYLLHQYRIVTKAWALDHFFDAIGIPKVWCGLERSPSRARMWGDVSEMRAAWPGFVATLAAKGRITAHQHNTWTNPFPTR